MLQLVNRLRRWGISFDAKKLPYISFCETVCISYYFTGNIKKAWHVISEATTTDDSCEISNKMMNVLLLILKNHESLFSDIECLHQLKDILLAMHKYPEYADILTLGTLLYWEIQNTAFSMATMDSETLLMKATQCLKIWTHWFLSVGSEILEKGSDVRVMLNIRFLRTVAELAMVNFQNFVAVTSLSYVCRLAHFVKHRDIARDVTQAMLSLIPQMGLQYVQEKEDVFMDSMGLGEDSGLLCLIAVASHYLKTGQFHKFMLVRDTVNSQFPSFPLFDFFNKGNENETVIPFAKAVIKRLEAEFLMMPGSRILEEITADCEKPLQYALYLATSSLGHIESIFSLIGDNFPRVKAARDTLGPWKIIHEYLCILKLMGELSMYTGLAHNAFEYLKSGLHLAKKFRLVTWGTIFSNKLTERELILDNLEFSKNMLQDAYGFLKYRTSTLGPSLNHCHGMPTIDDVSDDKLTCGLKMFSLEMGNNSCQQANSKDEDLEENLFSNLLEDTRPGRCETSDQKSTDDYSNYLLLTDITSCCSCCQTELISVSIHLMCLQAEILWKKEKSICQVSHLLQHSLNMAHQFARMAPCNNLINFIAESGWKVCPLSHDIASNKRTLAETALKCAEIYFQNLYVKNTEFQIACDHILPGIDDILRLLDIVETVSKKATGFHMSNVFVASALLARNHCSYLTLLRALPDDDFPEAENYPDNPCRSKIFNTVRLAAIAVVKEKKIWDNKRLLVLSSVKSDQLIRSEKTSPLVNLSDQPDYESSLPELDHLTEKSSWFKQLTRYFPTLAANQNVTERTKYLQRALQQFYGLPHSLLFRQISQSLALCLWEKQMTDVCCGTNETSSSQMKIAAHLMESMHVTFQHMMTGNFCFKLSFTDTWEGYFQEKNLDKPAIQEALEALRFGGDVMENFQNRLASLPADWTVVQMTIVNFEPKNPDIGQMFITRLNHAEEPITVGLPNHRWQSLKTAQKSYAKGTFYCDLKCRSWKNNRILETLVYMQEVFLDGYKWFLRGQLDCVRQNCVQKVLDDAGRRAANILQQHGIHSFQTELRNLLEIFIEANEVDILSVVESMYPSQIARTLTQICMDLQREVFMVCGDQWSKKRGPVILILDNELTFFPWESMPDLNSDQVTRIPSFVSLISLLKWHEKMDSSLFNKGVERTSVTVNIPCQGQANTTLCIQLAAELRQYKGWSADNSCRHLEKLQPDLQNSCLYLHIGHRWQDYRFVQYISGRALAITLGCNTGLLKSTKNIDGDGAPLYFLMAGCPASVGNLTVTYLTETSTLVSKFSSLWMSQNEPVSVRELLVSASKASKMFGTHGTCLVVYGLPVVVK